MTATNCQATPTNIHCEFIDYTHYRHLLLLLHRLKADTHFTIPWRTEGKAAHA